MSHFVYDGTSLAYPKADDVPLAISDDPTKFVQASEWNLLNQAVVDLRDVITLGKYHGFTAQALDPTPVGVAAYIWSRTDGALLYRTPLGPTNELVQSSRSVTGTAGLTGGGTLTGDLSISHSTSAQAAGTFDTPTNITTDAYGHITAITANGIGTFVADDATNNDLSDAAVFRHTAAAPVDGVGASVSFEAQNDAPAVVTAGRFGAALYVRTAGSEKTRFYVKGLATGTLTTFAYFDDTGLNVTGTITATSFSGTPTVPQGSAGSPGLNFASLTTTGFFAGAGPFVGVSIGGTEVWRWAAAAVTSAQPVLHPDGAAATPSVTFTNFSTTGFFAASGPVMGVAVGGAEVGRWTASSLTIAQPLLAPNGAVGAPSVSFTNFSTSGLYAAAGPIVVMAISGAEVARWAAAAVTLSQPLLTANGAVGAPSHSFTNFSTTGWYAAAGPLLSAAVGGVEIVRLSGSSVLIPAGSAGTPALNFNGFTTTGLYAAAGPVLGLSVGGTAVMTLAAASVTSAQPLLGPNGSAAAPTYAFTNFSTTGWFAATGPLLSASIGGTEVARFSGQRVFIGGTIATPSVTLHVKTESSPAAGFAVALFNKDRVSVASNLFIDLQLQGTTKATLGLDASDKLELVSAAGIVLSNAVTLGSDLTITGALDHNGSTVGFYGVTPVTRDTGYTSGTGLTADKTTANYTADDESTVYTGIDNAQGGTPYAQLTDLNALRVAYENLRAAFEDYAKQWNAGLAGLINIGVLGA